MSGMRAPGLGVPQNVLAALPVHTDLQTVSINAYPLLCVSIQL